MTDYDSGVRIIKVKLIEEYELYFTINVDNELRQCPKKLFSEIFDKITDKENLDEYLKNVKIESEIIDEKEIVDLYSKGILGIEDN